MCVGGGRLTSVSLALGQLHLHKDIHINLIKVTKINLKIHVHTYMCYIGMCVCLLFEAKFLLLPYRCRTIVEQMLAGDLSVSVPGLAGSHSKVASSEKLFFSVYVS